MAAHRDTSRTPPANLSAERAFLGAALLYEPAATGMLDPREFYKPSHQHIAHAIRAVTAGESPVDAVTVADELRRAGLLDDCGGREALLELQNDNPSLSRWPHYARIVHDTWAERQVLAAAATVTDAVYNNAGTGAAVGRAIDILEALTKTGDGPRSNLEIADIAAVLAGNLQPVLPSMLKRTDGGMLLYAGKMHSLVAESGSGKSFIACVAVVQILEVGGSCIYFDWEDSARGITDRLLALGARPEWVMERFVHIRMHAAWGPVEKAEIKAVMDTLNPDLIVLDAWLGALASESLAEDSNDDIEKWANKVPRWLIAQSGAAVLILDHVAKDPEHRGRYARGAGHKLNVLDGAQYQVRVTHPWSKTQSGAATLICGKDRLGNYATGEKVAALTFEPAALGQVLRVTVAPYLAELSSHGDWKPTVLMGKIARAIAESASPLTATAVKALFSTSKPGLVTSALARLQQEGFVRESRGARGRTKTLTLLRPYGDSGAGSGVDPEMFPEGDVEPRVPEVGEVLHNVLRGPWADRNWSPPDEWEDNDG